jgi:hypothetical protein
MTRHSHWCTDCKREWSCKDVKCWMAVVSKCARHSNPLKIKETMFRGIRGFAFVCLVMMLCGCPAKPHAHMEYLIPPECLTAPVKMKGCTDEDHCKKAEVKYSRNCPTVRAQIEK